MSRPMGWRHAVATTIGATALIAATVGAVAGTGPSAAADAGHPRSLPAKTFASATSSTANPDDITLLDGHVFVGFQNGVGSDGTAGPHGPNSTIVEYRTDGAVVDA